MSVADRAYSSVRWTSVASLFKALLQFIQLVVLARLMPPSDFGVWALTASIVVFAVAFSDAGIGAAIVHYQQVSDKENSSLYWLNVIFGFFVCMALYLGAPFVADFYSDERLVLIVRLVSVSFLFNSIGQQLKVWLEKRLYFEKIAIVEMVASATGFVVALTAAWFGAGPFSMAYSSLAVSLSSCVAVWLVCYRFWHPSLHFDIVETFRFLRYGFGVVFNNMIGALSVNSDVVVGARVMGVDQIGIYGAPRNFCFQIGLFINPIVTRVAFPVMAGLQGDVNKLASVYLKSIRMIAAVNVPVYFFLACFSDALIEIFFGKQWAGYGGVLTGLAAWGLLRGFLNPVSALLQATGHVSRLVWWNFIVAMCLPVCFYIGAHGGAFFLALALSVSQLLIFPLSWIFLIKPCVPVGFSDYVLSSAIPLLIALFSAFLTLSGRFFWDGWLCLWMILFFLLYGVGSYLFNKEWFDAFFRLLTGLKR
jgi:lipopolysaccharide exporter